MTVTSACAKITKNYYMRYKMKKILLIGDSIRMGYDRYVKAAFDGVAEVCYPKDNCMFSGVVLRFLPIWADELGCGKELDLIHFNAGLWDDLIMLDQMPLVSQQTYRENLERICVEIKLLFPTAKMIFATSTPVLETEADKSQSREGTFKSYYRRYNKDTEVYNDIAREVVEKHGGAINDLYTLLQNVPSKYHSDKTHYYTKDGTRLITEAVVSKIEAALNIRGKTLDFDQYFKEISEISGQ